jgi:cytochrome c
VPANRRSRGARGSVRRAHSVIRTLSLAATTLVAAASTLVAAHAPAQAAPPPAARSLAEPFSILVFSKTAGFRHDSIPAGIAAI